MKKTVGFVLMFILGFNLVIAQTNQLSKDESKEQDSKTQTQPDIKVNATQQFILKPNGTWQKENTNYTVVVTSDNKKYALFESGKWSPMETVKDADGNEYEAVKIGKYFWMTKNMQTTKYSNGQPITLSPNKNEDWKSKAGAYTNIENKPENKNEKGLLYSWHVVNNPYKICPKGWRVPSEAEWMDLITIAGGKSVGGTPLKATQGWTIKEGRTENPNGTDALMFNAITTGYRQMHNENSAFWQLEKEATFWTMTSKSNNDALAVTLNGLESVAIRPSIKFFGRSIRCIK